MNMPLMYFILSDAQSEVATSTLLVAYDQHLVSWSRPVFDP